MKEKFKRFLKTLTPWKVIVAILFTWFIAVSIIIPIVNLLKTVFVSPDGTVSFEIFSKLLKSKKAMNSLKNSFILGPTLAITVGIVGIFIVLVTEYFDIKGSKILRLGYMTTLLYGGIILVSGYKFIYGSNGFLTNLIVQVFPSFNRSWFQGYWAVLFVMTFSNTSNHMIFLSNAMRAVDFQTVEAARNMGANQWTILKRVVLPVMLPSLFAVTILTFITGLSAMSAPQLVGGTGFQTINPMIKTFADTTGSKDLAALLSIVLGLATMILLYIMTNIEKRGHYMSVSKVKTKIVKQKIANPVANVIVHILAYVLFIIYVIPVILIILFSFTSSKNIATRTLDFSSFSLDNYIYLLSNKFNYTPFVTSIVYSILAAVVISVIVVAACRIIQKNKDKLSSKLLETTLMIPWLLPITLVALALMLLYNQSHWYMFGKVLTGTTVIMLIGYVVIKLPFSMRMIKAAFFGLDNALEDASKNLGAKGWYTFRRIILPSLLPTIMAVAALNINALSRDYDMSSFLYHPIYPTLGVKIKSLTEETANANGTALTLVYAVLMMIISGIILYLVYGRGSNEDKPKRVRRKKA